METCRQETRDKGGRFVKGVSGNPKGNNQFTSIVPLLNAIEETGKVKGQDFWKMVAEKCYGSKNESLLIAVLKKILPDKLESMGEKNLVYVINGRTGQCDIRPAQSVLPTSEPTVDSGSPGTI